MHGVPQEEIEMALTDELTRLHELHQRGGLSDEEYARAKARLLDEQPGPAPTPAMAAINALRRSASDRWVGGVCGGIAVATGVDSWVWRLIFATLLLWGGVGLLVYLLLWVFVPEG
jgi:phage shock protein PspC (stress-responsive transcriptional regulator)